VWHAEQVAEHLEGSVVEADADTATLACHTPFGRSASPIARTSAMEGFVGPMEAGNDGQE
jgi:hypothetical protein